MSNSSSRALVSVRPSALTLLKLCIAGCLLASTACFLLWSWHWPLVGDAALIHYIAFLISHGMAPYSTLGDMNMPGSFLIELGAMHLFGGGDIAWRLFDLSLLAIAAASFALITRRAGWFPAVFSASLFALVHGRDGLAEGGQRDLTMAVLLIAATALLFLMVERRSGWAAAGFGLLSGVALTIKPTALPLSLAQLAIAAWILGHAAREDFPRRTPWVEHVLIAGGTMLLAPAAAVIFLVREHAVSAFLGGLRTVVPYYASLGHRPLSFLLLHSISPLLPLALLWLATVAAGWPALSWQRGLLACGAAFGLISYLVQARGLPYYRYPLLVFLLPLIAFDLTAAVRAGRTQRSRLAAVFAVAALCFGGFFLGPQSAALTHRYRWWEIDFISSLQANLNRLGGPALTGRIQCVDSISGCGATLYRMRLLPATGVLSDFLLFGPDDKPVIQQTRATFRSGLEANPPRVIIVSSWLHMDGPDHYQKLDRWPWIKQFLASRYVLDTEWSPTRRTRWWSREETPASYRIYVLRQTPF